MVYDLPKSLYQFAIPLAIYEKIYKLLYASLMYLNTKNNVMIKHFPDF